MSAESFKPAFVVGITGHMDLEPIHRDLIKAEVRRIFAWLRASPSTRAKEEKSTGLGPGLGLKNTPIILLSSLAPGADQLAVEAAREMDPPIRPIAPLPFLKDQYLEASTFNRDGVTKAEAKFLADFPEEDIFVVRLLDEIELDDAALRARHRHMLTGPAGKQERDRRYAAAGQYVAVYSDILIAVTDTPIGHIESAIVKPGEQSGARAIAELKRRGVTPGLLPVLPTLSWADNGPVIHIYAPRKNREKADGAENAGAQIRPAEMLYPYDCRPPGVGENDHANPAWCKAGYAVLKAVASNLQRLNSEKIPLEPAREENALLEMLPATHSSSAGQPSLNALLTADQHLRANLDRLARLRRRVADYGGHYNAHLSRLKQALFSLAFCSAFFFALADNWNLNPGNLSWPQIFFATALGLTLATWIVYFCFKKTAAAERCDDYRAIAEGLRVQFYWTASGSGKSVASNYLQRQRGELGWIRKVIAAAAFPFESSRVRFGQLSLDDQLTALESIRKTWISGQYAYFKDKIDYLSLRQEVYSTYAQVLLWSGFILFAFVVFFSQHNEAPALPRLNALLCFAAGAFIFALLYRETRTRKRAPDSELATIEKGRIKKVHNSNRLSSLSPGWLFSLPRLVLPQRMRSRKGGRLMLNSLLVGALTLLIIGTVYLLDGIIPWLPPANKLATIFKYLCLAGGVLCGAWLEANFFAENIRQYTSMASLFQAAGVRFDDYFNWLAQAGIDQKETVGKQVIANTQSLIVAVGREALSENAEWLITHRTRPIEPVSV